jgi:ABC-type sulfate/molybdate transport systems ATPase subunit
VCIILVTHQMYLVRRYCDRVIYLKKGQILFQGDKDKAIKMYMKENFEVEKHKEVNTGVEVLSKRLFDKSGKDRTSFKTGEDIFVDLELNFSKKLKDNMIRFWISQVGVYGNSVAIFQTPPQLIPAGIRKAKLKIENNPLYSGSFILGVAVLDKNSNFSLIKGDLLTFEIIGKCDDAITELPFTLKVN